MPYPNGQPEPRGWPAVWLLFAKMARLFSRVSVFSKLFVERVSTRQCAFSKLFHFERQLISLDHRIQCCVTHRRAVESEEALKASPFPVGLKHRITGATSSEASFASFKTFAGRQGAQLLC